MKNRQQILRTGKWCMLVLMLGSIFSPVISLAQTVESTIDSTENTEAALQTLSSDSLIPTVSTDSLTEETAGTSETDVSEDSGKEVVEPVITFGAKTIDEHELLIHEDSKNPQPSIKNQQIEQEKNRISFSGKLFSGVEKNEQNESKTIITSFSLQSKTAGSDWETEKEWLAEEIVSSNLEYDFNTDILLTENISYSFRFTVKYKTQIFDKEEQVLEEKNDQGYFNISEVYSYQPEEKKDIENVGEYPMSDYTPDQISSEEPLSKSPSITELSEDNLLQKEQDKVKETLQNPFEKLPSLIGKEEINSYSAYSRMSFQPFIFWHNTFTTQIRIGESNGQEADTGITEFKGDFIKNSDTSVFVSGFMTGEKVYLSDGFTIGTEKVIQEICILYKEQGTSAWTKGNTLWTGYQSATRINYNGTQDGFQIGKTYDLAVGVNYYHNGHGISSWESRQLSGWIGPTSGGTISFSKPSTLQVPYIVAGSGGPSPTFQCGIWYENGTTASKARLEVSLDGVNACQTIYVESFNVAGQEYIRGQFSGLKHSTTYYVRSVVEDEIYSWQVTDWVQCTYTTNVASSIQIPYFVWLNDNKGAKPTFQSGIWYQNGTPKSAAKMELSLDEENVMQTASMSDFNDSGQEYVLGQFSNLEPNTTYYIRGVVNDNFFGEQKTIWYPYTTGRASTIQNPYLVNDSTGSAPVFQGGVWYENGATSANAKVELSLDQNIVNQSVNAWGFNDVTGQEYLSGQFSGLSPNTTYYIRIILDDPVWGMRETQWKECVYTPTVSKVWDPFVAGNDGNIDPVFWGGVEFKNGTTIANSKMQISTDKLTILQTISVTDFDDNNGMKYLSGQFFGLNWNTRYYVRSVVEDSKWGEKESQWVQYDTKYIVKEKYYAVDGSFIKDQDIYVKNAQQYNPAPANSFTHSGQAYIYQGWLRGTEWNGNSATPMPSLNSGAVDPLTTHDEKVYLIYDLDSNSLRLDEFPNKFDFGNQHKPQGYNQIFGLDASKYSSTEPTDGFKIRVRDDRASHPGWKLTSTFSTMNGVTNSSDNLIGAKISFGVDLREIQNPGTPSETAGTPGANAPALNNGIVSGNTATLSADGSTTNFLRAANTKGEGVWDVLIDFDSVKLFVPAGQGATGEEYRGTIQWDLEDSP